jgi:site-specific recombinase XerC
MKALVVIEPPALPVLTATLELAADFAKASKSKATMAAYGSDGTRGLDALPASAAAVAAFLADEATAGRRASTLGRRLAAIRYFHRAAGHDTPTSDEKVKAVLAGIRRTIGAAPVRKRAATADIVLGMMPRGDTLRQLRDRAIILIGFAGAFRRSELVALDVADIEFTPEGALITIRRSKTDQEGLGRKVAIPRGDVACPVEALKAWLAAAAITAGAIFVRIMNKRAAHHGQAPGRPKCRRDRQSRGGASRLRPRDLRRPFLEERLGHDCSQARRQPDENLRPDRAQEP